LRIESRLGDLLDQCTVYAYDTRAREREAGYDQSVRGALLRSTATAYANGGCSEGGNALKGRSLIGNRRLSSAGISCCVAVVGVVGVVARTEPAAISGTWCEYGHRAPSAQVPVCNKDAHTSRPSSSRSSSLGSAAESQRERSNERAHEHTSAGATYLESSRSGS